MTEKQYTSRFLTLPFTLTYISATPYLSFIGPQMYNRFKAG